MEPYSEVAAPSFQVPKADESRFWSTWSIVLLSIALVTYVVHFLFYRYAFPPVSLDESSFFSPAYNLATKGQLSSDVHASFFKGADTYTYWMPPLYMVLLAGVFKVLGATVLHAKLFSFVLALAAAFFISRLGKENYTRVTLASLVLICPFVIISSGFIRMEALGVLLTVLAILAVNEERSPLWMGLLAGLGVMTHPLVMACGAALALHNLMKGWRALFVFGLAALITLSPYLWYIAQNTDLFQQQMGAQLARKAANGLHKLKADYVLQVVPFGLLGFYLLWKVKTHLHMRLFLAVGMLLSVLIILKSNEFNYQIYLMPYVLASLAMYINEAPRSASVKLIIPVMVFGIFGGLLVMKLAKTKFRDDDAYMEMIAFLKANNDWQQKNIYVMGNPDLTTYLMMENQKVERKNAVAATEYPGWFAKFNYVIAVVEDTKTRKQYNSGPWKSWHHHKEFTTSDHSYTVHLVSP